MGKGDKKTKKGKRWRGSYGNTRPRKSGTNAVAKKIVSSKQKKAAVSEPKPGHVKSADEQKIKAGVPGKAVEPTIVDEQLVETKIEVAENDKKEVVDDKALVPEKKNKSITKQPAQETSTADSTDSSASDKNDDAETIKSEDSSGKTQEVVTEDISTETDSKDKEAG